MRCFCGFPVQTLTHGEYWEVCTKSGHSLDQCNFPKGAVSRSCKREWHARIGEAGLLADAEQLANIKARVMHSRRAYIAQTQRSAEQ